MKKEIRGIIYDTTHATLLATNRKPYGKGYQALYLSAPGLMFVYTTMEKYEDINTINAVGVEHWLSTGYMTPVNDNAVMLTMEYLAATE